MITIKVHGSDLKKIKDGLELKCCGVNNERKIAGEITTVIAIATCNCLHASH